MTQLQSPIQRRTLLQAGGVLAASAFVPRMVRAQSQPLVLAVNEGVTYRVNPAEAQERWAPVAADLSRLLKAPVKVQIVSRYPELKQGLSERRYALAYVHPAHHAIRAMTLSGYRLAALTKGWTDYRASFFVAGNSPLRTLTDVKGKKIGAPDEDSITSVMLRATLRDAGLDRETSMTYVRYQDAVPFMVEHGLANAGVSASKSVIKAWTEAGGRVIATSKPVPIKQLIVSPALSSSLESVTDYFTGLEVAKDGKARLETLNVAGFVPFDEEPIRALGQWMAVG